MKKIAIVIMFLFTVGLTGGLHHTHNGAQEVTNQANVEQLSSDMPDIVFNSVSVIPLY